MKLSNHNADVVRCLPPRKRYVIHHPKFSPFLLEAGDLKPHLNGATLQPIINAYEHSSLPKSEDGEETLYCVCRQPYNPSMWMIACDICDGWFHGRCVNITAQEARKIEKYVCPVCKLNTGKQIVWKKPKKKSKQNNKREQKNGIKKEDSNGTATSENQKKRRRTTTEDLEARAKKKRRKQETSRKNSPQNSPSPGLTEENSHSSTSIEDDESVELNTNSNSVSSSNDVIKCICGKDHEDGLMVQCENCSSWLHCSCLGFKNENEIPDSYVCPPCTKKNDKSVASLLCSMPNMNGNFVNGNTETAEDSEGSASQSGEESTLFRKDRFDSSSSDLSSQVSSNYFNEHAPYATQKVLGHLRSQILVSSDSDTEHLTFGKEYS
eukprot:gb/GECH01002983.1/.p1 GENE.gb/GECH01002983.1/~~gb/GECH01002983.1/.p1  ORF type:complete len:380 (+),score=87.70 gb/GECH01002983.1/:1-1140(+)